MNPTRLIHSHVVLTFDEIPSFVSIMPCTIHGCRPLSVRNQPAVFIKNGSTAAHTATPKNSRDVASFLWRMSDSPHRRNNRSDPERYATGHIQLDRAGAWATQPERPVQPAIRSFR